jgi:hypothetical protein
MNEIVARASDSHSHQQLPLANRYAGAWFEYNSRIVARHNLTTMYLSAATLITGFIYSIPDKPAQAGNPVQTSLEQLLIPATFALPVISVIYALFMWMHDALMGGLHHYMIVCEELGNTDEANRLPSFHIDDPWKANFFRYRSIQNALMGVMIGVYSGLAMYRADAHMSQMTAHFYFIIVIIAIILAVVPIFTRRKWANRSAEYTVGSSRHDRSVQR